MGIARLTCAVSFVVIGCGDNIHTSGGQLMASPRLDLHTTEAGGTASFTVALSDLPIGEAIVELTSLDPAEGTVSPAVMVFTGDDYNRPRTATITGVDDLLADGDTPYAVRVAGTRVGMIDLEVTNDDDDTAGVVVAPQLDLMTSEDGTQATFTVGLTAQPAADVTIPVTSSDETEGATDVSSITFTPDDWTTPRTVVVSGVQDAIIDGAIAYSVLLGAATSTDNAYNGLDPDDVQLTNIDDDFVGFVVSPLSVQTSEAATQDSFTVVLDKRPTADVTISVISNRPSEATVSTMQLTFTSMNWDMAQTVTVTGVNDPDDDGDQPYIIALTPAVSTDPKYSGLDPADVSGINIDDDEAGVTVSAGVLTTTESGGSDAFTVVLTAQPTGNVTIPVVSGNPAEGIVSVSSLTFTPLNWNQVRTVFVTGVDDPFADGDRLYDVQLRAATSSDPRYSGYDPFDVLILNIDNDTAGFTVTPTAGLFVSELMDTDTFTIVLNTPPQADVTVMLTSSNPGEGSVSPSSVTFTSANWNLPRTITVTGVDDALPDGNRLFSIVTAPASSSDPAYGGRNPPDVQVSNIDNDTAQVYVKAARNLSTSENLSSVTFQVGLTIAPTADVTCTLQSSDLTEGTVSPMTLVFTPASFGLKTVTVTGVNDAIIDGDVPYTIVLNTCTSADAAYNGVNPRDVALSNRDND